MHDLILYDGTCGLCHAFVRFVIERDSDRYLFASLQSSLGQTLLCAQGQDTSSFRTMYLFENWKETNERCYTRGKAATRILRHLQGPVSFLGVLRILPAPLLNLGYFLVARIRFWLWGRHDACKLPSPEDRKRFLSE